jgi:hypothetical protein
MSEQAQARRTGAFSPAVMIGLALVSVFSFAAFILLSAFEPELTSGANGGVQALSQSAVGFAGAVRLLREVGAPVSVGRVTGDLARRQSTVIVTPEQPLTWTELLNASGATTLVILPKWATLPDQTHRGWVARVQAAPPEAVARLLADIAPGLSIARATGVGRPRLSAFDKNSYQAGQIDQLQTISGDALAPIVTDAEGHIVLARVIRNRAETGIYLLADPDFLNTQGIADVDNAAAGMGMLGLVRGNNQQPIVFDVTLNGLGSARSAFRLAFQPPFLGFTLGFAIAGALLAWRAALRFGPSAPVQRAIALGKAALAENSAALIRLARREQRLGPGYARMTATVAADKLGLGRQDEAEIVSALDRIGAVQGADETYSHLAATAGAAKSSQQMLEAARKLYAWKKEIARAAR